MLTLKNLKNRVYEERKCISFMYVIINKNINGFKYRAYFEKSLEKTDVWNLKVMIENDENKETQIYNFSYVMYSESSPLTLVAATGLRYFQKKIKDEINEKIKCELILSNTLMGM